MGGDAILIVFISCFTASLAEGLTYLTVYRTNKYKKLKAEVDKQSKKLEKRKETIGDSLTNKNQKRRLNYEEEKLKTHNRDLSAVRMKSMLAIGFCATALLGVLNSAFEGRVVAKLPFTPVSLLHGISHRGLNGDDFTQCSFIFLYILCTMSIRQNLQKYLGFNLSRTALKQTGGNMFQPPQTQQAR